ncbi:hypothetical protein [Actinoplanes sp. OR16]|uniref:hypothetical protein n=1 Tax=Actinoplanes sp. OR16 TaxID=946334 RepID=UPI0018D58DCF|nr:hypothetical protein [Actinoplanes sp. OR16]
MPAPQGRWMHSFEEDHDGIRIYRPDDWDFPRARGRSGIEFRDDGTYVDWAIGRGDADEARPGRWEQAGDGGIQARAADGRPVLRVSSVEPDRLEVRD